MTEAATQRPSPASNANTHVTVLAVLNFLFAGLVGLGGFVAWWGVWFAGREGARWTGMWWMPETMAAIGFFVVMMALFVAVPALMAGIGLSQRREWGRILTLVVAGVVGVFALISFTLVPLAYSAYAFWALTRPEVVALFDPDRPPATASP